MLEDVKWSASNAFRWKSLYSLFSYLSSWALFSAIKAFSCCCCNSLCFAMDFNWFLEPIAWKGTTNESSAAKQSKSHTENDHMQYGGHVPFQIPSIGENWRIKKKNRKRGNAEAWSQELYVLTTVRLLSCDMKITTATLQINTTLVRCIPDYKNKALIANNSYLHLFLFHFLRKGVNHINEAANDLLEVGDFWNGISMDWYM